MGAYFEQSDFKPSIMTDDMNKGTSAFQSSTKGDQKDEQIDRNIDKILKILCKCMLSEAVTDIAVEKPKAKTRQCNPARKQNSYSP
mmetsp:Transcript_42382/g.55871  ORF Transcript_42382/g.55871 Transcript_42382/m.55871 type:complete len:86 (-) Transcript_42382:1948-2205(-)